MYQGDAGVGMWGGGGYVWQNLEDSSCVSCVSRLMP